MDGSRDRRTRMMVVRPVPIMFGLLTGLAAAVLLQQFAVTPLTTWFLLAMLVAGAVVIGIVLPTAILAARPAMEPVTPRARNRRVAAVSFAALLALVVVGLVAISATAQVEGPCSARINDEPFQGQVTLPDNGTIAWEFTSRAGNISSWDVRLEYAWFDFTLDEGTDDPPVTTTKSDVDNVNDYPRYGVGVYRVTGDMQTEEGENCEGVVDVVVPGNPLTTLLGGMAAALTLVGVVGGTVSAHNAVERSVAPRRPEGRAHPQEADRPSADESPADPRERRGDR